MLLPSLKFIQDELDDAAAASEQVSEMGNPNYIDDAYSEDQDGTEASHLQDNVTVSSYVSNSTKKSSKSQKSRKSRQSQSSKGSRPTSAASSINSLKSSAKSSLPPESDSEDGQEQKAPEVWTSDLVVYYL